MLVLHSIYPIFPVIRIQSYFYKLKIVGTRTVYNFEPKQRINTYVTARYALPMIQTLVFLRIVTGDIVNSRN